MSNVLAIHDLSTLGKASLGMAIPILSSRGLTVNPMPTMVLSSITAGFGKPQTQELTEFMQRSATHFSELDVKFDWIYTGFLGAPEQVDIIIDIIKAHPEARVLIDPVFGDNGKLYQTMGQEMVEKMKELVKHADIITPNWTEARFLLNNEFTEVQEVLERLPAKSVVITSAPNCKGVEVDIAIRAEKNSVIEGNYEPKMVTGTGDAFASVLICELDAGKPLEEAAKIAAKFVKTEVVDRQLNS